MKTFPYLPPKDRNVYLAVRTWLGRNALRHLHQDYWKRGEALPAADELTGWLWDLARKARDDLSFEKLARVVDEASSWALVEYNPDAEVYVRARKGGSRSIQLSDADLLSVRGLSHAEAARVLHVSKSTIRRRRESFDPTEAELDALIVIPETSEGNNPVTVTDDWRTEFDRIIAAELEERLSTLDILEGVEL
jgi:hypothetical protein